MSTGSTDQNNTQAENSTNPKIKESGTASFLTSIPSFFSHSKSANELRYPYFDALARVSRLGGS